MPNRSKRDEKQSTGRPKVGPADPETRRRLLAEHERKAREESRAGLYQAKPEKPKPKSEKPTKDLSIGTAARRIQTRRQRIEDAVDEAVNGRRK